MQNLTYEELVGQKRQKNEADRRGTSARNNIDKSGHCYHVITQSWCKEKIFTSEAATYRHNLLCRLCVEEGIVLLFSVTMPTHTHEVFFTPDWKTLARVIRILNLHVSRFIRKESVGRAVKRAKEEGRTVNESFLKEKEKRHRIFDNCPTYILVPDLVYLLFLGKYIFDNPNYLKEAGRSVPFSCFWMFEKNYFKAPYDETIYTKLFGLSPPELFRLYSTKTKAEVMEFAQKKYGNTSKETNDKIFRNKDYGQK